MRNFSAIKSGPPSETFMKHFRMASLSAVIGLFTLAGCEIAESTGTGGVQLSGETAVDVPSTTPPSDKMELAEQAREDGEYEVALALFREIIAEKPTDTNAYLGIGDTYLDLEKYRTAEPYYERAARIEPRNYRAQFSYGRVLQFLQRFVEALRLYHRALDLNPDGMEANLGLGATYLKMDEPEHAVAYAEKAVQVAPTNGDARANLGRVYEANGRNDEAIEQFLVALELIEDPRSVMHQLTSILIKEARYVEARNTADSLVKLDPSGASYTLMGRAQFKLGSYRDSIVSYRMAAQLDPDSWDAWNGVGINALNAWLLSDKSEDAARLEARDAFRHSLQLNNDQQKLIMLMQKYGLL
jgi:tetratricopeptide (TPR) repeat protein